ncbi:MBL fold metallo-hydrolase [Marinomonas spartinae]|uniref:MBL fold metallo-hydrolase n=1 Tax=Marinomonas spartinae TaxID=1792290 RepID=UPI0018F199FE|nr:ribonuclease Z [Marinomonas spartinae]MBJ7553891.1 ribonuclease Z [Marinomonas spartinae]
MKIDVIGCGSAFSKIHNTSSVRIEDKHKNQWLIDCGPTVPRALWQRHTDINAIQAIYFTHIHPDHCSGLAALINQWKSMQRTQALDIYCQKEQQEPLESLVALAVWPERHVCFEIRWHEIEEDFQWRHWSIKTALTQHEMANRAIRLSIDDRHFFYSGDGRPTPESEALMLNTDLAFQECAAFYSLPKEASHGDLPDCLRLLARSNLKKLGLYHCFDEALPQIRQSITNEPRLFLSQDGQTFDLT